MAQCVPRSICCFLGPRRWQTAYALMRRPFRLVATIDTSLLRIVGVHILPTFPFWLCKSTIAAALGTQTERYCRQCKCCQDAPEQLTARHSPVLRSDVHSRREPGPARRRAYG